MIDFVKIALFRQQPSAWLQNPLLRDSVIAIVNNEGVVREQRAFYRGQTVCVKPGGYVEIFGSLHKFYTGGSNATDFSAADIALSVKELGEALQFEPGAARLQNIEFGVNQVLPISAKSLLKRAVLFGNADFTGRRTFGGNGHQIDAEQQRYTFKAYDKAAQLQSAGTHCGGHLLRSEVRVTRMIHLAPAKLATLADLACPGSLAPLGELLVKAWDKVLFHGPAVKLCEIPRPRRELLMKGQNADYWESLSPDNFRKQRGQFRKWTEQHSPDPIPAAVRAELAATWARLSITEA
jgi:hypothetical protein